MKPCFSFTELADLDVIGAFHEGSELVIIFAPFLPDEQENSRDRTPCITFQQHATNMQQLE